MIHLRKYLKPFYGVLVFCIFFLLVQAFCELILPNFMSNIVNIGIQNNGIANSIPEAICVQNMEELKKLTPAGKLNVIKVNYTLTSLDHMTKEQKEKYPFASKEREGVYFLNKQINATNQKQLSRVFDEAAWVLIDSYTQINGQNLSQKNMETNAESWTKLYNNITQINAGDLKKKWMQADKLDDITIQGKGILFVKKFYTNLGVSMSHIQQNYVLTEGCLMILVALISGIVTIMVSFFSSKFSSGLAQKLRQDIFEKIESFSYTEFDRFSTASLITRSTNDVMQVQGLMMMGTRLIVYAPLIAFGSIVMAVNKNPSMSWIIIITIGILAIFAFILLKIALPKFRIAQKLVDRMNLVARENLTGLMVIRAFGTEDFEKKRFDTTNKDLMKNRLFFYQTIVAFAVPFVITFMNLISILIVWIGIGQIVESKMKVGDMIAFMQYTTQMIIGFLLIAALFIFLPRAIVSGKRIYEILSTELMIKDPIEPEAFDYSKQGFVEFENVSFSYVMTNVEKEKKEKVLKQISFIAKPGETTAIIGSTGSGKSTLVNLIPRLYDVSKGTVKVNGVDVRHVDQDNLHDQIGYIPQKSALFAGTIISNLTYGEQEITQAVLEKAIEVAQAKELIETNDKGLNAEISQGGSNLSGGQKQRLSIARALVKKPVIYIFDDSFSSLDLKTDARLRKALKEYTDKSTVFIVAQRVETIMDAEQILVLEQGEIVGKGTHKKLLDTCPIYYEMAASQFLKEEVK